MINTKNKFFKLNLTPHINEETQLDGGGGILLFDKPSEYYQEKNRFVKNSCGETNLQQVNLRTGKLSVHQFIYGVQGNRLPFNLTMTYNPTFAEETEIFNDGATTSTHGKLIGKGWKLNYQQYLRNQNGKYYYYDENFEEHVFEQSTNDTSVYFDKSGQTGLTLCLITNGYEISDGKNTTLQFNIRGELVKIIQQLGTIASELTIEYDSLNRVSCITDGMSRTFNFTYDDQECVILKQGEIELVKIINSTQLDHLLFLHRPIDNHYENITYLYARPANGSKDLLSGINDYGNFERVNIGHTDDGAKVFRLTNFKTDESGFDKSKNSVLFAFENKKTITTNLFYPEDGPSLFENKQYYYFAENGELIYSLTEDLTTDTDTEQTLADKAKAFLDSTSFATAKDFKHYETILSQLPIKTFEFKPYWISIAKEIITVDSGNDLDSKELELGKVSNQNETFIFSAKAIAEDGGNYTGDITVRLKENDNILATLVFDSNKKQIQNSVVVLTPAVHELKAEIINGANKSVTVSEVKLHYYSNVKDSDVISYGDGIGSNWQEVGKITLQLGETSIENVDFTFNDYLQTAISVMKHPNSFNLWYNKGKNLISGCNSTTVKFCFNGVILEFDEFKYAKKQENSVETQIVYLNYWTSSYAEWIINRTRGNETKTKKVRIDNYLKLLTETEDGISDNYYYDNYGNCTKVKSIGGTDSSCNIQSEWGYTNGDRLTSEKTFKNLLEYTTQYTHNSYGNVTKTILPNGQNINYTYTPNGELLTDVHTTLSGTELKNSLGYLENNLSSIKSLNNPEYQFLYDKFNNLKKVERSNKTLFETNTHYNADKSGYVETKNADGVIKRQYFDKYGHVYKVVKVENGNEIDILWLFYGDNDSVLSASVPNDYEHYKISKNSKLYQIVDKTDDVSYNAIYYYDDLGNITYIDYYCKSFTNTIAERDEYNRPKFVESIAVYDGQSTAYTYSNAFSNELASEKALLINDLQNVYHLETTYQKDSLNRLVSTTVKDDGNNGYKQEITYCTRDKKVLSGGDITPIAPFALKPIYKVVTDGTTPYISEVKTYNYNNGSLTQIQTDAVTQNANGNITKYGNNSYIYDDINRLIRENNADLGKTFVYEYDAHGNILSKKEYAYTIGLIGEVLATTTYSYDEYDKLVAINGVEVTYNNAGKPLSYNGKTFTWEDGKLKSVNCGGNKTVTFKRDIGGLESTKTVVDNNVTKQYPKIYENNILKFEYETAPGASNYTRIIYLYNSQGVIGFQYNNDIYAYRKNLFGDITEIYSGATCVAKYKYDAWGNCTVCNPDGTVNTSADFIGNINPFRYRGYYWDRDLGLYHLQTRYYDPAIGRFISLDSYEYLDPEFFGGLNLYCYCINNPVNYKQRPVSSGCSVTSSSISVGGSTGIGGSSGASDSVSNGSAPWYAQTIVGALPDLYSGAPYLMAKGMHKYFAYKKNYYYMFPILGETHKRLAIHSTSFWKLSNATFRELVTGNAKASIGSVIGSIAGVGFFTFGTNLLFNLHENGFDLTDKAMWIDTGIDTAIGMGAYGLAMGTASLATAGLAMAGVALPGIVVIGGVIVLSIGFDHLIRAISGYWE